MASTILPDTFYHISSRAVGAEKLFVHRNDYLSFLKRAKKYLLPTMHIYAYCLIPNHYHLLTRTKDVNVDFSKVMADFLNSYTRWKNVKYERKGTLFITPFNRKLIDNIPYLMNTIYYIHRNPIHHYLADQMDEWEFSSYNAMLSIAPTVLERELVLELFEGPELFRKFHQQKRDLFFEDYHD